MDYMTTKDAAREWNITPRRVSSTEIGLYLNPLRNRLMPVAFALFRVKICPFAHLSNGLVARDSFLTR